MMAMPAAEKKDIPAVSIPGEVGSAQWQLAFVDALWLASLAHPEDIPFQPPC